MSQQPPQPPYGGPPAGYGGPPGGPPAYPPGPYPQPQGPRPGMSNKAKFWIGVALSIPAVILGAVVSGGGSAVVSALGGDPQAGAILSSVLGLLMFAGLIAAIVFERTRWFALGIIAGVAVLLILLAGACIVLLVALSQSFS